MPSAQIEQNVLDYLRNSQTLADYWHQPIRAEQLQAEMERMAQQTGQPEVCVSSLPRSKTILLSSRSAWPG